MELLRIIKLFFYNLINLLDNLIHKLSLSLHIFIFKLKIKILNSQIPSNSSNSALPLSPLFSSSSIKNYLIPLKNLFNQLLSKVYIILGYVGSHPIFILFKKIIIIISKMMRYFY